MQVEETVGKYGTGQIFKAKNSNLELIILGKGSKNNRRTVKLLDEVKTIKEYDISAISNGRFTSPFIPNKLGGVFGNSKPPRDKKLMYYWNKIMKLYNSKNCEIDNEFKDFDKFQNWVKSIIKENRNLVLNYELFNIGIENAKINKDTIIFISRKTHVFIAKHTIVSKCKTKIIELENGKFQTQVRKDDGTRSSTTRLFETKEKAIEFIESRNKARAEMIYNELALVYSKEKSNEILNKIFLNKC